MAKIVMVVRLMPSEADVDLEGLLERVKGGLPEGVELKEAKIEPLAFGMSVIEAAFTMPEEEGVTDKLEEYLKGFPEIEEVSVVMTGRI